MSELRALEQCWHLFAPYLIKNGCAEKFDVDRFDRALQKIISSTCQNPTYSSQLKVSQ